MIQAEVKSFEWDDFDRDETAAVELGMTLVVFIVGLAGTPDGEIFQATVCTPRYLEEIAAKDGVVDGRHFLIVDGLNRSKVEGFITKRVSALSGRGWPELAEKVARLGYWEFEDYQE